MKTCGVLVGLLASGCAGTPAVPDRWFADLDASPTATSADFPGSDAILTGFAEPGDGQIYRAGDRALYGLEFANGQSITRWTMLVEVVDPAVHKDGEPLITIGTMTLTGSDGRSVTIPLVSEVLRLRLTRFDESGHPTATSELDVARDCLTFGFARGCEVFQGWVRGERPATDDELRTTGETVSACESLFRLVQEDDLLADVLWQIARTPSVWSVVTHGGVDVGIDLKLDASQPFTASVPGLGTRYRLPLEIQANDEPSLLVVADVVEPRSPWNVAAGVVALTARRPGDESANLSVRLLAAQRAPD